MGRYGTHCEQTYRTSYNASFASQNVAKVMMKENDDAYSMASFNEFMSSNFTVNLIL